MQRITELRPAGSQVVGSSSKCSVKPGMTLTIDTGGVSRNSSVKSIRALHPQPTPCDEPDEYFGAQYQNEAANHHKSHVSTRDRAVSLTVNGPPRQTSGQLASKTSSNVSPTFVSDSQPWDRDPSRLPTSRRSSPPDGLLSTREWDVVRSSPRDDGAISPALSSGSKTDLFFASTQTELLPTPPKPMSKGSNIGRGLPDGLRGHDRTASLPTMRQRNDVEPLALPTTRLDPGRRIDFTTSSRIFSNDIPSSPLSTLPTFPEGMKSIPPPVRLAHTRRDSQQLSRETREVPVDSAPLQCGRILTSTKDDRRWPIDSDRQWRLLSLLGEGAFSSVWSAEEIAAVSKPTVAAVKLTSRATCASNSRTRIAFLREVSVLRHLSHPTIVTFLGSFSTSSHHCLVLEQLSGGELFDLVNADENYDRILLPGPDDEIGEGVVRRIFGELCRGVGWLHEVGVVHRDIKLESKHSLDKDCIKAYRRHAVHSQPFHTTPYIHRQYSPRHLAYTSCQTYRLRIVQIH
jgi:tRNA (cytidine32/guanosine34-2'-O)-methyltransferase